MRFQTTDRVPCDDAELVLAVLEDRLHTLGAREVVRDGRRITLFGLGPSPRAINPRDKTMIEVNAADGVTTIDADVSFQASSFLGEAPQDQIVMSKLERVFDEIKAELGLNGRRVGEGIVPLRKIVPIKSVPVESFVAAANHPEEFVLPETTVEILAETETVAAPHDVPSAVVEETPIAETAPEPIAEIVRAEDGPAEAIGITNVDEDPVDGLRVAAALDSASIVEQDSIRIVFAEPEPEPEPESEPAPETVAVRDVEPVAIIDPEPIVLTEPKPVAVAKAETVVDAAPPVSVPVQRKQEAERWVSDALSGLDEKEPTTWRRIGWTAAAVGLVSLAIFGARDLVDLDKTQDTGAAPATVSAMTSTPVSAASPSPMTAAATTTTPTPEAKSSIPEEPDDPAEVVKQWGLAMQSRDASAQAAFYADTVGRYFLRSNVPKDAVQADKQAEIDKRKDSWAIAMDRVKINREGDRATVSLVKHFTTQGEGDSASEWFVPTQLKLKREDGRWRIVSERALGWATSLDDLDG